MSGARADTLRALHCYWQAANYLSVGQIYLLDNALLRTPLLPQHVKPRLLTYQDLIEAFVPVMWVEEGAEVTDKLAAKFRSKVYLALTLKQIFLWGGAVIAGVLAVFTVWSILIWRRKKRADEEPFSAVPSRSQRLINPTINEAS